MEYRRFGSRYVVRIDKGEEVLACLERLCQEEGIRAGSFTGLGAAGRIALGLFDTEKKQYRRTEFTGLMEITSLVGNISEMNGKPYLHCHITACREDMTVVGGHLNECHISGTAEIAVDVIQGTVGRRFSEEIGLNLYTFSD